ncbi:uncharacterized protein [Spinacia oleracea]|uniref:Uncharacterized protein n=1 Tax=Spinacia oleracea TaxID=3562 RepID=A0ABM3R0G1_SPIOL|nr:uncharacterized protein LOC130463811 [Spinacia oleracea]
MVEGSSVTDGTPPPPNNNEFHPAHAVNNIKNAIPLVLDMEKDIFQDNKNTRVVYLEHMFNTLHINNFPNVTAYCQELKNISGQLSNVDQDVSGQKMVLRLVARVTNTDFDTVATMIQQTNPLPSFVEARSRLRLEETRRTNDQQGQIQDFVAQQDNPHPPNQPHQPRGCGGGGRSGGHSGGRDGVRGQGRGRGGGPTTITTTSTWVAPQHQPNPPQHGSPHNISPTPLNMGCPTTSAQSPSTWVAPQHQPNPPQHGSPHNISPIPLNMGRPTTST